MQRDSPVLVPSSTSGSDSSLGSGLLIGVAVLRDDGRDPLGMRQRQAEPHGRAVIEDVNRVAFEADSLCEGVDDLGQVLKRVAEPLAVGCIREAESREVGCDHMVTLGQGRNEVTEHVRRCREAVQQEYGWGGFRAGFAKILEPSTIAC